MFAGNSATNRGGAIRFENFNDPITNGNVFVGNTATNGAAIYDDSYAGVIANNTIVNNNGHGIVLATISVPTIQNNIIAGNAGYGLQEVRGTCYFQNNDVFTNTLGGYYDRNTMAAYNTAAQINQSVVNPGGTVSGNLDTTPGFKAAPSGTATAISYDPTTFRSVLTSPAASFVPNSLVGLTVNPSTAQMRHFYVVANTATTITTWGDMTEVGAPPTTFQVFDYHLSSTSQNINAGINVSGYGVTGDIDGTPRPSGGAFDIGADEFPNRLPTITSIGIQVIAIGGNTGPLAFTIADADTPATSLTLTRTSSDLMLLPLANVVLAGSGPNRTVTATPVATLAGTAQITLTVSDGEATVSTSFNLTVIPIVTLAASGVVFNGATLNGTVNPSGLATTIYFEYGTTTAYGASTASQNIGAGTSIVPLQAAIGALTPNTTYHYRVVATTSSGTVYGPDRTFRTLDDAVVGTWAEKTLLRNLPIAAGSEVDIGAFTFAGSTGSMEVAVNVVGAGISVGKRYVVPIRYNLSGISPANTWLKVLPTHDSGPFSGKDFDLEVNVTLATASLRLRATTTGTGAPVARIVVKTTGLQTFTSSVATGSVPAPTQTFGGNAVTELAGKAGVGVTPSGDAAVDINGGNVRGLRLRPRTARGAPATGAWNNGTIILDSIGDLYICTVAGTPGTWKKVGN